MKLNRLPVLIRTEVTAAAKGASLPAVYSRALVALEEAVEELSFAKLKTVEISAEGLAAWAKAHQDEKLTKTARELKNRARRVALYIAEKLHQKRKAEFLAKGGSTNPASLGPAGINRQTVLDSAGYARGEQRVINAMGVLPDTPEMNSLGTRAIIDITRGMVRGSRTYSDTYFQAFRTSGPLSRVSWFRDNNARGIARQLVNPIEVEKARAATTLMRAWCEEFLKNLPKTVSKAKVSK